MLQRSPSDSNDMVSRLAGSAFMSKTAATVRAALRNSGWVVTSSMRSLPTWITRPSRSRSKCSLPDLSMGSPSPLRRAPP